MKLNKIFEEISLGRQSVMEVNRTDDDNLQKVCDLINNGGQLSWELTPTRLLSKLGMKGKVYALSSDGQVVGTVGLKEAKVVGYDVAELGYLFVDPEDRSLKSVMSLYKEALQGAKRFDFVFGTTNAKNHVINRLLGRTPLMDFQFTARSPYSSNKLNYWLAKTSNGKVQAEDQERALNERFKDNIVTEGLNEDVRRGFYTGNPLETGGTSTNFPPAPAVKQLVKKGAFRKGMKVLDYGAGKFGRNANALRDAGIDVYAYDPFNGNAESGWHGVSNQPPRGTKFDVVFTAFVMNVVPEHIEADIIKDCAKYAPKQYHITRNRDIEKMIKNALSRGDRTVANFFRNEFASDEEIKAYDDGELSGDVMDEFAEFGVQTSKGFQRVPKLEDKGFSLIKKTEGFKVYER